MMTSLRRVGQWLVLISAAGTVAIGGERARYADPSAINAGDLREMVDTLADDTFEGREAGTRGGHAARAYLVGHFRRLGLQPVGDSRSYLQPFGNGYYNIVGVLPGGRPEMRDEYILVSAHYDHVGYGNRSNSYGPFGFIHNGADDNASGVAMLVEVAQAFVQGDQHPGRSLCFALWDAEEKGLLGSEHWLQDCPFELGQIRAMVNLDMVGRLRSNRLEVYGTRTIAGLRELVSRANDGPQLELDFRWNHMDNSDHHSFYRRSIGYLMFHTGLHEDYHRPSDDADLVNIEGMVRVGALVRGTLELLASAPDLGSFRAACRRETTESRELHEAPLAPAPSRLGITGVVEPGGGPFAGLRIGSIAPGSPAAQAGLEVGERLLAVNGLPASGSGQLIEQILAAPSRSTLRVQGKGREEGTREVAVELRGQPVRLGLSWRHDPAEPGEVTVVRVVAGSPAARAGIRVGDRLLRFGPHPVRPGPHLHQVVRQIELPLELEVERRGRRFTCRLDALAGADSP